MRRIKETFFTAAAILLVMSFVGLYGHAAVDDHGAEEVCQVCAFLQVGAPASVVFSILAFLAFRLINTFVVPLQYYILLVTSSGRSPPIV